MTNKAIEAALYAHGDAPEIVDFQTAYNAMVAAIAAYEQANLERLSVVVRPDRTAQSRCGDSPLHGAARVGEDCVMGLFWNRPCSVADLNRAVDKIIGEFRSMETVIVLTIADLKQKVATLTEAVAAQTTLDRSVAVLVSSQVATMRELSDRIAALTAGAVTQEDLSELSGDVAKAAQALAEGTAELAAAVPANTDIPTPTSAAIVSTEVAASSDAVEPVKPAE